MHFKTTPRCVTIISRLCNVSMWTLYGRYLLYLLWPKICNVKFSSSSLNYKFRSSCLNVSFLQRCPRANVALNRSLEGKHHLWEGKTCSCLWHWNTKIKKVNVIHFKTALFCERMNPEAKIQNKLCYSIWLFSNFTTNSRLFEYITSNIVVIVNSYIAVFIHL